MIATGNLPPAPSFDPILDKVGATTNTWRNWFGQIYQKIGGIGSSDFTPALSTDGTAGTVTYVTQSGRYTAIGTLRFVEFVIEISNWTGSPSGNVVIGGIPTAFLNQGSVGAIGYYNKITLGASHTQLGVVGEQNQTYAYLYSSGSGSGVLGAKVPVANVATTAKIVGGITFSV